MDKKFRSAAIKAADDTGTITGYFSTYDTDPDSYGDIVAPGVLSPPDDSQKNFLSGKEGTR